MMFREWLESMDGGKKSTSRAAAIATDISKFLANANPKSLQWSMLLDWKKITAYCNSLECVMTGSGIVQKLDSLDDGLRYMRAEDMGDRQQTADMRGVMKIWRRCYRKDKTTRDVHRMEARSDEGPVPIEDVSKVCILL